MQVITVENLVILNIFLAIWIYNLRGDAKYYKGRSEVLEDINQVVSEENKFWRHQHNREAAQFSVDWS